MAKYGIQLVWGAVLAIAALGFSVVGASAATPPSGSYQSSCSAIVAQQGSLQAYCRRSDGSWRFALLPNYGDCRGDIRNDNGRLACSRRGQSLPHGDWINSCRNYRVEGSTLRAECRSRFGIWTYSEINFRRCDGEVRNVNGRLACDSNYNDLPRGEWIRSCRNYRVEGRILKAECRDDRNRYRHTELNLRNCNDRVSNVNGRLVCGRDGDGAELPGGSWTRSCREGYIENRILYAECRNSRGRYNDTQLDLRTCRNRPVSNDNGSLRCGEGGSSSLPPGSWRDTCRNYRMDGSVLEAECQDRYGQWQRSELDTEDCRGGVANRNGRLACQDDSGDYSEIIRCESKDNQYNTCPIRTGASVELYRQLSFTPCTRDSTWGYERDNIWVDNGCRAEFKVEDRRRY